MTESEAISIIENFLTWNLDDKWLSEDKMKEFSETVISALEEIQKYRALGTVEEIEPYVRLAEKLNVCDLIKENARVYNKLKYTELKLREAMEKQRAKKPIKMNVKWQYRCPCCDNRVTKLCPTKIKTMNSRELFCQSCGQAIDWSEVEE